MLAHLPATKHRQLQERNHLAQTAQNDIAGKHTDKK